MTRTAVPSDDPTAQPTDEKSRDRDAARAAEKASRELAREAAKELRRRDRENARAERKEKRDAAREARKQEKARAFQEKLAARAAKNRARDFARFVARVGSLAGRDETRPHLMRVYVEAARAYATDGHGAIVLPVPEALKPVDVGQYVGDKKSGAWVKAIDEINPPPMAEILREEKTLKPRLAIHRPEILYALANVDSVHAVFSPRPTSFVKVPVGGETRTVQFQMIGEDTAIEAVEHKALPFAVDPHILLRAACALGRMEPKGPNKLIPMFVIYGAVGEPNGLLSIRAREGDGVAAFMPRRS